MKRALLIVVIVGVVIILLALAAIGVIIYFSLRDKSSLNREEVYKEGDKITVSGNGKSLEIYSFKCGETIYNYYRKLEKGRQYIYLSIVNNGSAISEGDYSVFKIDNESIIEDPILGGSNIGLGSSEWKSISAIRDEDLRHELEIGLVGGRIHKIVLYCDS